MLEDGRARDVVFEEHGDAASGGGRISRTSYPQGVFRSRAHSPRRDNWPIGVGAHQLPCDARCGSCKRASEHARLVDTAWRVVVRQLCGGPGMTAKRRIAVVTPFLDKRHG